ncbi:MAG: type IV pilin N-terminal domain-containing protein [Methanocorpusculum sp.]|nr:type IV pilin N-terminal domain-containing protein [Methanocorpusculum sp.]
MFSSYRITIIIAAVVSMFAGGLIGNAEKAPTLTMDVAIKNTGYYASSVFEAKVMSVSEPIVTKDLKLVTTWTATNKTRTGGNDKFGKPIIDGNITSGGSTSTSTENVFGFWQSQNMTAPWGYGNGVQGSNSGVPSSVQQQFGNYTLVGGTVMYAYPAGQSGGFITTAGSGYGTTDQYYYDGAWTYTEGSNVDGMQAVLGKDWNFLRTGDIVNVKLIHTPSGQTIYEKNVVVS